MKKFIGGKNMQTRIYTEYYERPFAKMTKDICKNEINSNLQIRREYFKRNILNDWIIYKKL